MRPAVLVGAGSGAGLGIVLAVLDGTFLAVGALAGAVVGGVAGLAWWATLQRRSRGRG